MRSLIRILIQVQVELVLCTDIVEPKVPMTVCNIANEVWMNLLRAYTLTRIINANC